MDDKSLVHLCMKVEAAEYNFYSLKRKTDDIPYAYEESLRAIQREKDIWERVLYYAKETNSGRQVFQKLEALEEKQRVFSKAFSDAEEEIQKELTHRKLLFEDTEQEYEACLREMTNENNV
ncbi:hypothetical protein [Enterococcus sp. LJL51]|uniref:hypothetical protein n=1 Tax=Enterococcus sp. LJL51 TaxID=3416656 RepID=UPI003CF6F07C